MSPRNPSNPPPPHSPTPTSGPGPTPTPAPKPGLMRSIGQFAGHIFGSVKSDASPTTHQVTHAVEEQATTDDQGRSVVLRRTTIEEVEFKEHSDPPGLA